MSVHDSDAVVARMLISHDSILNGKTIGELRIAENTGMWVIAVKKGNTEVLDLVNKGIESVSKSGYVQELQQKWIGQ